MAQRAAQAAFEFDAALMGQVRRAFESALGADKVFFEALDRNSYKDKFAINDAAHHPAGAIGPTTVEEVQAALRIANQFRVPIWPISRGKNLGCSSPASGSTISTTSSRPTTCRTGCRPPATRGAR